MCAYISAFSPLRRTLTASTNQSPPASGQTVRKRLAEHLSEKSACQARPRFLTGLELVTGFTATCGLRCIHHLQSGAGSWLIALSIRASYNARRAAAPAGRPHDAANQFYSVRTCRLVVLVRSRPIPINCVA